MGVVCGCVHAGPVCPLQLLEGGIARKDGRLQVGDVVKKVGHCLSVYLSVRLCGVIPDHAGMW